jgi:hypothetical protein
MTDFLMCWIVSILVLQWYGVKTEGNKLAVVESLICAALLYGILYAIEWALKSAH